MALGNVRDILRDFIDSGLHGATWPSRAYAVLPPSFLGDLIIEQNGARHAEHILTDRLRNRVTTLTRSPNRQMSVTVYMNYSPCADCADILLELDREVRNRFNSMIRLEVAFASLYNIQRNSCRLDCRHRLCDDDTHDRNVDGLLRLDSAGVALRTFGAADWTDLMEALDIQTFYIDRRGEDDTMEQDLAAILIGKIIGQVTLLRRPKNEKWF